MPFLRNPGGRIVEIDDTKKFYDWLAQPGFSKATDAEIEEYKRSKSIKRIEKEVNAKQGSVYFCTVSGIGYGNGFSASAKHLIDKLRNIGVSIDTYYDSQKVGLLYHSPYSLTRLSTPYKIIYTMFESDKLPADWPKYLKLADVVIVPSRWCADIFKKSGVDAVVVPLGYDTKAFRYIKRERSEKDPFTFIHYDSWDVRKGFLEVVNAFTEEFGKDMSVRLIMKTVRTSPPVPFLKSQYPNIDVVTGDLPVGELVSLIGQADCGLFPSRGEGFGMTPLEMMATGIPVIMPNAHGMTEYFNSDVMIEVKIGGYEPAVLSKYKGQDVGKMPYVDIDDFREKMRWAVEHRDQIRKMGLAASKYVKKYSFEHTAMLLKEIIDKAMKEPTRAKPVEAILPLELIGDNYEG